MQCEKAFPVTQRDQGLENLPSKSITKRTEVRRIPVDSELGEALDHIRPKALNTPRKSVGLGRAVAAAVLQFALVVAVAAGGYVVVKQVLDSAPVAQRAQRERIARLVEVETVTAATQGPVINAWGEVVAARTLTFRPEITGTITWVHPEVTPGGRLDAGEVAVRLDDHDFLRAIEQAEADIAGIQARIVIESGQAEIGKRELTRLSRNLTDQQRSLVLREPQMAQLRAELAAAEATLAQARNAAEKTEAVVPFDLIVISESIETGSVLTQGADAAQVVASDMFHVVLTVPAAALEWIDLDAGQLVQISQKDVWRAGQERAGQLVRLSSVLSATGRMAELIAEVPDPLALLPENKGQPPLLLGSFVNVTLSGRSIEGAVNLNRAHLRDDDTVWVMTADDKLEIRKVDVAWRGAETVLVSDGLKDGDRIVTTLLSAVSPGMALRTKTGDS